MKSKSQITALISGCTVIMFAPLAFGTVHPWSLAAYKTLILTMLFFSVWMIHNGTAQPPQKRSFHFLLFLLAGYAILQSMPVPTAALRLIFPGRYSLLFSDFEGLGLNVPLFHPISLSPQGTQFMLSIVVFYIALYFSMATVMKNRGHIKYVAYVFMLTGFIVSLIAVAQKFSGASSIYWGILERPKFYGPFVNPNHCAVFISSAAVFTLVYFLREKSTLNKIVLGFSFSIMSIAVLYSLSRGGILVYFTSVSILLFLFFKNRGRGAESLKNGAPLAFAGLVIILLILWWGTFNFFGELGSLKDIDLENYRLGLWKDTLEIFSRFFVFGTGLGTFQDVIPVYRNIPANVVIEFAENDYLQLMSELGLAGFTVIVLIIVQIFKRALKKAIEGFNEIPRARLGGIFGLLCIALNSMVSFNFYIPGIMTSAVLFLAFLFASSRRHLQ